MRQIGRRRSYLDLAKPRSSLHELARIFSDINTSVLSISKAEERILLTLYGGYKATMAAS